jgi:hypothetical protein
MSPHCNGFGGEILFFLFFFVKLFQLVNLIFGHFFNFKLNFFGFPNPFFIHFGTVMQSSQRGRGITPNKAPLLQLHKMN